MEKKASVNKILKKALDAQLPRLVDHFFRPSPFVIFIMNDPYIIGGQLLLHIKRALFVKSRKVREEALEELERLERLTEESYNRSMKSRKLRVSSETINYE